MDKTTQVVLLVVVAFIVGMVSTIVLSPTYILSDRRDLCEELGGKYYYAYNKYYTRYDEECIRLELEVDLNQ